MFQFHSRTQSQFVLLPPQRRTKVSAAFQNVEFNSRRHNSLLAGMQQLRGKVYLDDGAIHAADLTADGRHRMADDASSWHVLAVGEDGRVTACLRYLDECHSSSFRDLWVSKAALAHCPRTGWKVRSAVRSRLESAKQDGLGFGSVGGWAAAPDHRRSIEPVSIILATYGLLQLLGGCLGVATATFRHHSATMLRKIGLRPMTWEGAELPPYYDPKYGCEMEILEFDSRFPNPKYREAVLQLGAALLHAPVVCHEHVAVAHDDELMAAVA